MNEAIYGVFASVEDAERAISALKDHGAGGNEISVVRKQTGAGLPRVEDEASTGITVTSAADVTAGALKGGAAGLALGILAGAVALTIPGIGPILAAGPIATAIGAAMASTAAGVVGGGVVGYLVDQGVPEEAAHSYHGALDRGDILVVVRAAGMPASEALLLLEKYGATSTSRHPVGDFVRPDDPPVVDTVADLQSDAALAARAVEVRERVAGAPEPPAVTTTATTTTTRTTITETPPPLPPTTTT